MEKLRRVKWMSIYPSPGFNNQYSAIVALTMCGYVSLILFWTKVSDNTIPHHTIPKNNNILIIAAILLSHQKNLTKFHFV